MVYDLGDFYKQFFGTMHINTIPLTNNMNTLSFLASTDLHSKTILKQMPCKGKCKSPGYLKNDNCFLNFA